MKFFCLHEVLVVSGRKKKVKAFQDDDSLHSFGENVCIAFFRDLNACILEMW